MVNPNLEIVNDRGVRVVGSHRWLDGIPDFGKKVNVANSMDKWVPTLVNSQDFGACTLDLWPIW